MLDDGGEDVLTGLHESAGEFIGEEDGCTVRGEHGRNGGFAAAQTSGEADAEALWAECLVGFLVWQEAHLNG